MEDGAEKEVGGDRNPEYGDYIPNRSRCDLGRSVVSVGWVLK